MKRTVLLLTAAAVALSPLAASAAPAKATKRTVTFEYSGFNTGGHSGVVTLNVAAGCAVMKSCWDIDTVKGEKTIEVTADDPAVGIQIWTDNAYADTSQAFCGKGKISVAAKSAHKVHIRTSLHECGAIPSSGTLTAVITGTK